MLRVPRVYAHASLKRMENAATNPGLFVCRTANGERREYVVKFLSQLKSCILCEFIAALLGQHLGLRIPPIAIVDLAAEAAREYAARWNARFLSDDDGPHFGSLFITGGKTVALGSLQIRESEMTQAVDIFAFDMLIQNPDRSFQANHGKPNLLSDGEQFFVLDHEKAFSFLFHIGTPMPPWELRGLPFVKAHLFYSDVAQVARNDSSCFSCFLGRVEAIPDLFFDNMVSEIPPSWHDSNKVDKIIAHLKAVRENAPRFNRGLMEVLA